MEHGDEREKAIVGNDAVESRWKKLLFISLIHSFSSNFTKIERESSQSIYGEVLEATSHYKPLLQERIVIHIVLSPLKRIQCLF